MRMFLSSSLFRVPSHTISLPLPTFHSVASCSMFQRWAVGGSVCPVGVLLVSARMGRAAPASLRC